MVTRSIYSKAPTRIDLAGGTIDIWPLFLFLSRPLTLNVGINLYAETWLEEKSAGSPSEAGVKLHSKDQGNSLVLSWSELLADQLPDLPPGLELHSRLLRFFAKLRVAKFEPFQTSQITLSTRAQSPAGAGLGGSSALSISLVGALAEWAGIKEKDDDHFIEIVRDVETKVIKVPAGLQDYYGARYGGLQGLSWGPASHQREHLPEDLLPELEKRFLLFYSGQSRNSGINNWTLFKDFIDDKNTVRSRFQKISDATQKLKTALLNRDWLSVGEAIGEEWNARKTLATGISTPEIEEAIHAAHQISPVFGKVCGAGGGGCFYLYLTEPDKGPEIVSQLLQRLEEKNIRALPFQCDRKGLHVARE